MNGHISTSKTDGTITPKPGPSRVFHSPTTKSNPSISKAARTRLLTLQISAFIDAAEDVEIEPEVYQDLLELLPAEREEATDVNVNIDRGNTGHSGFEDDDYDDDHELDLSPLYSLQDESEQWSKDEIRWMMKHLKEHGMTSFVQKYVVTRAIPISKLLSAFGVQLCPELFTRRPSTLMYFLKVAMSREVRLRDKLPEYNTIADAVSLIRKSERILILTGAGISVSCGIPDFRSRDGVYASLGEYELDDPQQMFDISYFRERPAVFYSFARQIYPSNFVPSPCHRFIKLIENKGKLLRNYTQNIDTLETLVGVQRVLQCHGSFATASCLLCRRRVSGKEIEADVLAGRVPLCTECNVAPPPKKEKTPPKKPKKALKKKKSRKKGWDSDEEQDLSEEEQTQEQGLGLGGNGMGMEVPAGIMKPDITFFGEKLSDEFDRSLEEDRFKVDLLLVIGTSLKVAPVADILSHLPHSIPQILINKTPIRHINPDIVLLGNADDIVLHLTDELGWTLPSPPVYPGTSALRANGNGGANLKKRPSGSTQEARRVGNSHVWLFEGAEGGRWLREFEQNQSKQDEGGEDGREAKKQKV